MPPSAGLTNVPRLGACIRALGLCVEPVKWASPLWCEMYRDTLGSHVLFLGEFCEQAILKWINMIPSFIA